MISYKETVNENFDVTISAKFTKMVRSGKSASMRKRKSSISVVKSFGYVHSRKLPGTVKKELESMHNVDFRKELRNVLMFDLNHTQKIRHVV